jgi:hypothetical protein
MLHKGGILRLQQYRFPIACRKRLLRRNNNIIETPQSVSERGRTRSSERLFCISRVTARACIESIKRQTDLRALDFSSKPEGK